MKVENVLVAPLNASLAESRFGRGKILILIFSMSIFVLLTISSPVAQFAYDETEASNASVIWSIRERVSLYHPDVYKGEQLMTLSYSPLYFYLSGWISKLTEDFFSTIRLSRALGVAFVFLIWWMIYLIAQKLEPVINSGLVINKILSAKRL